METKHNLLLALFAREIRSRYQGSVGGVLWVAAQPLLLLMVYGIVFGVVFRPTVLEPKAAGIPYIAIIATALWPWLAFSEAVVRGMMSVQAQAALIKRVAFPSSAVVTSAVLATFSIHFLGAVAVIAVLALTGVSIRLEGLPVYIAGFAGLLVPAIGLALLLAAIQTFIRDTEQIVSQAMTLAFYATPVLYTADMLPPAIAAAVQANPIGRVVDCMRSAILGLPFPSIDEAVFSLGIAIPFAASLCLGVWVFSRLSPHFEDAL